jgi:hypothetical protein
MRARYRATWPALLLAGLILVSCTGEATTTTTQPAPTTTTAPQSTDLFGFVRNMTDGTLVFDPAELLTGDEAVTAAREAGIIGAGEDLPNDFFIRNLDLSDERQIAVGDGAIFVLIGFDASGGLTDSPVSADEFEGLLAGSADNSQFYGLVPGDLPMTLVLNGDTATGGSQTYLP